MRNDILKENLNTLNTMSVDDIIRHLTQPFSAASINYRNLILYTAETLCKLSINRLKEILFHSDFKNVVNIMCNEYKYIPDRTVPITVDVGLRFKYSKPKLTSVLLHTCFEVNNSTSHIYDLLFLASHCTITVYEKYKTVIKKMILSNFHSINYSQLDRLFDNRNEYSVQILREIYDQLLNLNDVRVFLRLYILSYGLFPQDSYKLVKKIVDFDTTKLNHLCLEDRNLVILLKNNALRDKFKVTGLTKTQKQSHKIKVAICISGQLRGYEKAFPSWQKALKLEKVDSEIFVSVWEKIGGKKLVAQHLNRYFHSELANLLENKWVLLGERKFYSLFRNLINIVDYNNQIIEEKQLSFFYKTNNIKIQNDEDIFEANTPNIKKMCFKIEDCYEMALNSGIDFDLYVRIRPDLYLEQYKTGIEWSSILATCNDNTVLSDFSPIVRLHQMIAVGDQVLIANKKNADVAFRPYSSQIYLKKMGGCSALIGNFTPHNSISIPCVAANIKVRKIPGIVFSGKNLLNPVTDIAEDAILQALTQDCNNDNTGEVKQLLDNYTERRHFLKK